MTKADLVEQVTASIAKTAGPMISKKDCARVVDAFLEAVKEALKANGDEAVRRIQDLVAASGALQRVAAEARELVRAALSELSLADANGVHPQLVDIAEKAVDRVS